MKKLLEEPLLHFALLGAALFVAYGLMSEPGSNAPGKIIVSVGQIEHLAAIFSKTWQRPPTDPELKGLIDDWIREEIATREAMALGLDKDDTVIRRRLRQKLEFVFEDITAQTEPTDADLTAYLQAHPESFRVEPRLTFSQIFLDPEKHGEHLQRDARRMLATLTEGGADADRSVLGDSFLLGRTFQSVPASEVGKQFGESFASALARLSPGQWHGPVDSAYGVHLVWVSERTDERLPELNETRDTVRREWENAQRLEGNATFYQELLNRYSVTIESAEPVQAP